MRKQASDQDPVNVLEDFPTALLVEIAQVAIVLLQQVAPDAS
jgi:hypothetical protein